MSVMTVQRIWRKVTMMMILMIIRVNQKTRDRKNGRISKHEMNVLYHYLIRLMPRLSGMSISQCLQTIVQKMIKENNSNSIIQKRQQIS
jgi:hypothetical protein